MIIGQDRLLRLDQGKSILRWGQSDEPFLGLEPFDHLSEISLFEPFFRLIRVSKTLHGLAQLSPFLLRTMDGR